VIIGIALLAAGIAVSGGTTTDPPVPSGFPGVVPAFLASGASKPAAVRRDRRWLSQAAPLGKTAPFWANRMYRRSLLVLRACVNRRNGAAVAGAPAGWAYVWPRDAGAIAIALAAAGYREEARNVARFLTRLELGAAARFDRNGDPVEGRAAQGDAAGWVAAAAKASGLSPTSRARSGSAEPHPSRIAWRGSADYQEKDRGDYLGNAIAAGESSPRLEAEFGRANGLVRSADDPDSGLDSAAAWAVRPFPRPALFPMVRRTLLRFVADRGSRLGLLPSQNWDGGEDPWTAPAAWTAWALAALARTERDRPRRAEGDRRAALGLMADLRRATTPLGLLPERVDAHTGLPTSTTPLAWSHAFAILAIRELWPPGRR
jgi:glucoamylase